MDSTNKVLALFVGLFVVILLIGVGLSRLAKNNKSLGGSLGTIFTPKIKITPTPTKTQKLTTIAIITTTPENQTSITSYPSSNSAPTSIPETGATTLPVIATSLFAGLYLLKRTKSV